MGKTLNKIKSQIGDSEYRKYLETEVELIKKHCNIGPQDTVYFLCHHKWKEIFLINGIIYISRVSYELKENKHINLSSMDFVELYKISLFKDCQKTLKDIAFEVIVLKDPRYTFTPDEFFDWIDMPSEINIEIDNPYYEIIKFLNLYTKEMFETDRYSFYPKRDGDSSSIVNLYAYDKKTDKEMKLYIPEKCENINGDWLFTTPTLLEDIVVDDLGNNISNYLKRECKKAFIEFANKENSMFKVKNYWVMELVKQTVQPVKVLHEWSCHRIFAGHDKDKKPKKFTNIWVYDHPKAGEEPYFFITNSPYIIDTTKVAVLNFKSPTYHTKGIYKKGNVKAKGWELDEQYIKELIEFLKSPVDDNIFTDNPYYQPYVKTNWQQLIFEYNHNTAGWGWGDKGFDIPPEKVPDTCVEALSFGLPIPDYTKLLDDKPQYVQ